jgi:Na+-transporting methylmalonyl-CoA/oxaloacetate decarboxylase gamma subunit
MDDLLPVLLITVIGMGLVFLGIIVLYFMMLLMTRLTSPKKQKEVASDKQGLSEQSLKEKAAAVAVASVLAQQKAKGVNRFPLPPTAIVSAWQLTMRTRQLDREQRPK